LNGTISFELSLKRISFYAPRFPLSLTAKFNSLHAKESGVGNFGKVVVRIGVGCFASNSATLVVEAV